MQKYVPVVADEVLVDIRTVRVENYIWGYSYTTPLIQRLLAWGLRNIYPVYDRIFESALKGESENMGTVYILETRDEQGREKRLIYEGQQRTLFIISNLIVILYNIEVETAEYKRIKKMLFKNNDELVNSLKSERNCFYIDTRPSVNKLFNHLLEGLEKKEQGESITLSDVVKSFDFIGYSSHKDAYTERIRELLPMIETTLKSYLKKYKFSFQEISNYMLTGIVFEYRKFTDRKAAERAFINLNTLGESLLESEIRKEQIFSRPEYLDNSKALMMYHYLEGKYNTGINSNPIGEVEKLSRVYLYAKFNGEPHIKNGKRVNEKVMMDRIYKKLFKDGLCPIEEMYKFEQSITDVTNLSNEKYSNKVRNIGFILNQGLNSMWKPVLTSFALRFPDDYESYVDKFFDIFLDTIGYILIFKGENESMLEDKCNYIVSTCTRFNGSVDEFLGLLKSQYNEVVKKEDLKKLLVFPKDRKIGVIAYALLMYEYLNGTDLYELYKDKFEEPLHRCTYIKYPFDTKNIENFNKSYQWGTKVKESTLREYRYRIGTFLIGSKEVANSNSYNCIRNDNSKAFNEFKEKVVTAFTPYIPKTMKSLFEGRNSLSNNFLVEHCDRIENTLVEYFERYRG